jgi:hypothetical protein
MDALRAQGFLNCSDFFLQSLSISNQLIAMFLRSHGHAAGRRERCGDALTPHNSLRLRFYCLPTN